MSDPQITQMGRRWISDVRPDRWVVAEDAKPEEAEARRGRPGRRDARRGRRGLRADLAGRRRGGRGRPGGDRPVSSSDGPEAGRVE